MKTPDIKKYFKRPAIQEVLRESTAGGVIFRRDKNNEVEILMIQDAKDRWTNSSKKEDWMNDIKWFPAMEALDKIEYEDISKLFLIGMKRIRKEKLGIKKA